MNSQINVLKFHLVFFLSLLTLFNCRMTEKQYEEKSFPKKIIAKKNSKAEEQTWKRIQNQNNKNVERKIKDLETFIKTHKNKEIALEAYLLKARIFLKNKQNKQACLSYHKVVQSSFNYSKQWKAYQASAKCYFHEGKLDKALIILERFIHNPKETLKNKRVAAKLQWTFLKSKKANSKLQKDFLKSKKVFIKWKLINLAHLISLSSSVKKQNWKEKGKNFINSLSREELILQTKQVSKFVIFEGYLFYKIAQHFWNDKEFSKAEQYFKKSLSTSLSLDLKKSAERNLKLIKRISKVNPYLIGVLVPLSGRRKALGEKILRGLYMGLDMEKNSPWQIIVMDSKSHPDVVRTHLENLFYKHHIIGVIGGLTSETAEVIANQASVFAIPAILFSQKKDLSLNRNFVFQNSITAEQLLKPLIEQVKKNLKIKKVAILYPDDLYGKEYAQLFSEIFTQKGGEIVGYEAYKTKEVDFKKHIKKLLHLNIEEREEEFEELKQKFLQENPFLSERSRKLTPENLLSAKKEFEALFIPDSLDKLQKIKDHLKYFVVKDIYLLGTDLWRQKKISSRTKDLPLVFVNLPKKNKSLIKSPFYKEFIKSYAQAPGLFEQRAYNTALFLKKALNHSVKSRLSLLQELKKIKSFQGAFYEIVISEDRVFNYPLNVYKADENKIHILDSMPVK